MGIGLAVAQALAQEGVHLALCARNEERLAEKAGEIANKYGVRVLGVRADVTKANDISRLVGEVERELGGADVVFLCSPRASYCVGSTYYVDGGWLNVVA